MVTAVRECTHRTGPPEPRAARHRDRSLLLGGERVRHRLHAGGRVTGVLEAWQPERLLHAEQQRVVVVRSVVHDMLLALVRDHDGHHATAAWVGATATRA